MTERDIPGKVKQEAKGWEPLHQEGGIEVIVGCMFSGKTDEFQRRIRRVRITLETSVSRGLLDDNQAAEVIKVFKPNIDTRYSNDSVVSHSGMEMTAIPIDKDQPTEIYNHITPNTRVVAIDEGQFFALELVDVCEELADRGARVIVAGLDLNFRGETFGPMGELMAHADQKDQFKAICQKCGKDGATRTQRMIVEKGPGGELVRRPADYNDPIILVGAKDFYEARCRKCHEVPGRPTGKLAHKQESQKEIDK